MRSFRLLPLAAAFFLIASGAAAQDASSARNSRTPSVPSAAAPVAAPVAARSLAPVLSEGFDNVAALPGAGWSLQNLSTPVGSVPTWVQGEAGIFPAQAGAPAAYIGASYQSVINTNTISNWLITPEVALANGTTLTFYTRTVASPSTYPDRLQVRLSTNGASTYVGAVTMSVGDFTTLLLEINPTQTSAGYPGTWTQYTATVSGLPGPTTGRFAFRHFVTNGGPTGTASDYIGVDEVVVDTPETFAFVQPTMGQAFRVGHWLKAIWESPSPAPADVTLSLRKGTGAYQVIYSGPNLEAPDFGAARYEIPVGTPAGDDYTLRIEDAADPTVFAVSGVFSITDRGARYTFTSPIGGESYAIGGTQTITWTAPAGASGTTVTLLIHDKATGTPLASLQTADDGSETIAIPPIAPAGRYYLTIVDDANAAYTGRSGNVRLVPVAVTAPVAGGTYSPGSTLPITWDAPMTDPTATVRIMLKSASLPATVVAAATENDGAYDFTIPAGLPSSSDYVVTVKITDGDERASGASGVFSIGSEPAVPPTTHFVPSAMQGSDVAMLRVEAPALADGAEVGVFLGERLLGAGLVGGGTAEVAVRGAILVPALVVDGLPAPDDFVYVADGAVLSLRSFDGVAERALETTAPVAFAGGTETTVTAKGGVAAASASALRVSAFPNPASSAATVRFETLAEGAVAVEVFDVLGRRVATLAEGTMPAGTHAATWDASAAGAGVYVVRVVAAGEQATVRLSVVR